MSGKKDEDESFTGVNKAKPSKRVGEQAQNETATGRAVGQNQVCSPNSSSGPYTLRLVSSTGAISLWEQVGQLPLKGRSQQRHLSQGSVGILRRVHQEGNSVLKPKDERQAPRAENNVQDPIEEKSPLPESLVDYLLLADPPSTNLRGRGGAEGSIAREEALLQIVEYLLEGAPVEESSSQGTSSKRRRSRTD